MKVSASLPVACCCWLALVVVSTLARPQKLQLTPREFRAFKSVLGNNRALSITSAIPVMAFSDKNPTKYVELPLDQIGGATGHPSPAELLVTSEEFGNVYGRGAGRSGPAFGASQQEKYQGVVNFKAEDHQRGGDFDSFGGDGSAFGPDKIVPLSYGFKPLYDSVGSFGAIGTNKATGGLVHSAFSPSTQVGQGGFKPIGFSEGDADLNLDPSVLGKKTEPDSGEHLWRHLVNKSLIPTKGAGPRSTAVGNLVKFQENALDNSEVVVRSVDGRSILNDLLKETNGKKLIDVSGSALQSSAAVGASITVKGSSQGQLQSFKEEKLPVNHSELSSSGFVSDSGAIIVRGGGSRSRETLPDPSASVFDSSKIEASSIFASNSIQIPQLPNVQLPLQTQEARSFEDQELPLSQSTFTGNQQQVKLITDLSNSQKRQVPQIPNSVTPTVKNTATASTESLLRLLRSQTPSESDPSTKQAKFTREISPQARQIPGAIPSRAPSQASASVSSNAVPQGFRPIPATPRQNGGRSVVASLDPKRTNIRFDNNFSSQQNLRPQAIPTQQAPSTRSVEQSRTGASSTRFFEQQRTGVPSTRSVEQPRTNTQFARAVSHQSQVQFHPQFSPGPFSQNSQVNPPNQLEKLQQRQQQQQQEQQHREQQNKKRREQLQEQQVLQQIGERQQKQEQRQQQQSQQQREQQVREQQQRQQQQHEQREHQVQHQQQQQQLQHQQKQQQQPQPLQQQEQHQQQQQQLQQQQKPQQQPQTLQNQKQKQQQQSQSQPQQQQQHQVRENQQRNHQHQQLNQQQSDRIGTKVTTGQRTTLQEFLSGDSDSLSKSHQTPRLAQATIPGRVSQQPALQQTQTVLISKTNSQQPNLQHSKATLTSTSGSQPLGLQVGKSTTSGSNSAFSLQSQQQRFVQRPTSSAAQVVSNQQVLAQPQLKAVQRPTFSSAHAVSNQQVLAQPQLKAVQRPTSSAAQVVSNQQVLAKPQLKAVQTSTPQNAQLPSAQSLSSSTSPGGTSVISASSGSSIGSLPASALQALGALGGGGAGGGQSHIVVKTISLDAKDADPNSEAFKKAVAEATKQARLELGVRDSEELGVASGDLANLFGKRRRKRQLFGGGNASTAQTLGNALSTGAGLFDNDVDFAHEEFE